MFKHFFYMKKYLVLTQLLKNGMMIIGRLNYKLHSLSLVKIQFSPLSFNRFNLVL
jgi:hypothetical protein